MTESLPFIFRYRDLVRGPTFKASVVSAGRLLATREPEGWWFYGVIPGAIAASGATFPEAHGKFREAFRLILDGLAADVGTFDLFRQEAERWFQEDDPETRSEWLAAVERVRGFGPEKLTGVIERAETPVLICIDLLEGAVESLSAASLEIELPALAAA